jgi:HEAT repeat protein
VTVPAVGDLIGRVRHAEADVALAAVAELGRRRDVAAAPELLAVLRGGGDGRVRGAAAVALAAMRVPAAFPAIVEALREPRADVDRLTLLRALTPYDCSSVLCLLVDLAVAPRPACPDEVRRAAAALVAGIRGEVDPEQWRQALTTLRGAYDAAGPAEREELIGPLLELVD